MIVDLKLVFDLVIYDVSTTNAISNKGVRYFFILYGRHARSKR